MLEHFGIVERLVGLLHRVEYVGRLEDVHFAHDGAEPAHGAREALLAAHLRTARQRALVRATETQLDLDAAPGFFFDVFLEALELERPGATRGDHRPHLQHVFRFRCRRRRREQEGYGDERHGKDNGITHWILLGLAL